ncbi:pepsin/retropepsin-like aspartic protease family protein [Rhizobium ruizarguesonis]|uniref:hypothetical protein n=1 Tax=Rhizobium ruizarguesonis TaxID=2081791 RepID=UPI001032679D|nr:hypothetical protein [Rhizobium ruizarguesonis]NEI10181.1 hypothetical protein [Rhizobium ruizarguesonis]TAY92559.1 hypothetical protein ELH85_04910 [Rhizobium ruizarguesonis]TAZ77334.1 hypothetical protein ELH68_05885 [Rhizobium ruizarguesonis]TBA03708.1 hypothetical protein ELH64_04435 [Rhizobium ruizarguesonis]TBA25119.1 hypothetical protein ELH61_04585 [Rhizobium ruizarguesonis]
MSVSVPVFLVDKAGNHDADNVNCSPCIDLAVVGSGIAVKAVALLDSGAAAMYADPEIIRKTGLPVVGKDTFFAVGHSGETTIHKATIWIDGLPDLQADLQMAPFRSSGKPYDMILGRSFLTMFDFGFDLQRRAWKLVLPGLSRVDNSNRLAHTVS